MRKWFAIAVWLGVVASAQEQPRVVDPGGAARAPSDAVVLFDGKDMSHWTTTDGRPARCKVADAAMTCTTGVGDIASKERFRSAQIHLEFAPPYMPDQKGQSRGNSGVYLHGRYEIQILDSYQNPTYAHGSCGGLYGQAAPLVNACRPPEQWQSYDLIFHGPRCGADGKVQAEATVTILQNGVLIHDHVKIRDSVKGCAEGKAGESGPLLLQDHNYKGAPVTNMKFRNIWFRPIQDAAE
ncbi:MAG: DUF1080 domain-containing protein [Acidobacteria bacterium]|nr:DUF1080 domain-containing protein [Acidobacteriota bacterium]